MENRYHSLPPIPENITATNIICRMLSGMGFRFYWATEGLTNKIYSFQPCENTRSIGETVEHIWDLLHWVYTTIGHEGKSKPVEALELREGSLDLILFLGDAFSKMENEELAKIQIIEQSFWPIINGPLSDALTHIGQIATLRRIAGSPAQDSNPFSGTPPLDK